MFNSTKTAEGTYSGKWEKVGNVFTFKLTIEEMKGIIKENIVVSDKIDIENANEYEAFQFASAGMTIYTHVRQTAAATPIPSQQD